MREAWRLSAGTFLAIPVRPPGRVDHTIAGLAMTLAPVTALPAALVWVGLGLGVRAGWLTALLAAALGVGTTVLLNRALHLDGLADLADGLGSGPDRDRALDVMKRGDIGPAGVTAVVLVLLVQAAALASLMDSGPGIALAPTALVASRLAPAIACRRGVPSARPGGLGDAVAGTVHPVALGVAALAVVVSGGLALGLGGHLPYAAGLVAGVAILAAWSVTSHAVRRLGGVTGDVIGAAIEVSLAAALVAASLATH